MGDNKRELFNQAREDFTVSILGYLGESETSHTDMMGIKLFDHRTGREYYINVNTATMTDVDISPKL